METKKDLMLDIALLEKATALFKAQLDFYSCNAEEQAAIQSLSGLGNTGNVAGRTRVYEIARLLLAGVKTESNQ